MEILLASNNKNKHKELLKIFQEFGSKHTLIVNEDIPDVIEDKNTIEENAKKKAEECYEVFKSPIISDDSGLFVDALGGQPGVHSKRYAGLSSTDVENNQKLINEYLKNSREEEIVPKMPTGLINSCDYMIQIYQKAKQNVLNNWDKILQDLSIEKNNCSQSNKQLSNKQLSNKQQSNKQQSNK